MFVFPFLIAKPAIQEIKSLLHNDDDSGREVARKILGSITGIKALVEEQTAILEDLKDIFERAVPDFKVPSTQSNKYIENMLRIPVLSGPVEGIGGSVERTRGQMSYVVAKLEAIVGERRRFIKTLQKTQATVSPPGI